MQLVLPGQGFEPIFVATNLFFLETRFTYKRILSVAGPIILGHLAENVINITDTIFVGTLGEKNLGAVGLGGLYYYTFLLLIIGLAMGVQILIGRRNGEKSYHLIGVVFDNALYSFAGVGILLFIVLKTITPALLQWLVKSPEIYGLSLQYINIRSFSLLFVGLMVVFRVFYIGITHTRVIVYITIGAACINIFLNQVFIFGHLGFKPMGIKGSALASVMAELCAFTGYLFYTMFKNDNIKYGLFKLPKPDFGIIASFLKLGVPIMLQSWISVSSWFVFFIFIEKMGTLALSISTILKTIYIIMMIPIWGFSSATNTLVSNAMGAERQFEVVPIVRKVMGISFFFTFIIILANIFIPETILNIFTHNPDSIRETIMPLRIITSALLVFSVGGIMFNAVSGTGSTRVSLSIEIITIIIYFAWVIGCGTIFPKSISLLWTSELVYMTSTCLFSFIYLKFGNWRGVVI